MNEQTHEINPPRDALEALISRVSVETMDLKDQVSGGLRPESCPELAAMISGIQARNGHVREAAELLFWSFLDEGQKRNLVNHLDLWGRQRVLFRCPKARVSGDEHRAIVHGMVDCAIRQESMSRHQSAPWRGVRDKTVRALMPHIRGLDGMLDEARSVLHAHLRSYCEEEAHAS